MNKYKKYIFNPRVRIAEPEKQVIEMHRNTRVDFYSTEFSDNLKKDLSLVNLNRYPDPELLYLKLAEINDLEKDNFLLTSGIDGAIKTVFEMCTKKGSNVVCLSPTYGMYDVYSNSYETNIIKIKSQEPSLSIDINHIMDAINKNTDIIFLVNPHEPIEHTFNLNELKQIITKAKKNDVLVFIDEAYFMFGSISAIELINQFDNIIVARTFSKGMGLPAIRLGYMVANANLLSYLETKRFAHEANSISINIAIWALDNIEIFNKYVKEICDTRDWLIKELNNNGYLTHGNSSNTILINLSSIEQASFITKSLKESGIWVRGGLPSPAQTYISITIPSKKLCLEFLNIFFEITKNYIQKESVNEGL